MNCLKTRLSIPLLLAVFIAMSARPLFAQTYNDSGTGADAQSWGAPENWSTGVVPGIPSAGTTGQNVTIGPLLTANSTTKPIILDTGETSQEDAFVSIGSLTFNDATGVEIASDGISFLTVTGAITNATATGQILTSIVVSAGTNTSGVVATYAGGPTGGSLNFGSFSTLDVGISQISTTGTVNVAGILTFTINASAAGQSHTTFGTIGSINATGATIQINPSGTDFVGTYPGVATLAADTGDFFKLTSGNFAGSTLQTPPAFTATTLTWITSLYRKGILFVEPTAGGNVINAGAVLLIGNDSEFNTKGTAAVNVTLNGGELLTNNNSSTLDSGGTSGAAYTTTNTLAINTTGGRLAATTGTTATYNGIISNGNGSTGTLSIGDSVNGGSGTVALSAANTYGGGTTITAGTLQLTGSGKLGATTGGLTLSGGTLALSTTGQTVAALNITGAATISSAGGTLTESSCTDSATSGTTTVSAGLAGTGALTQSGAGTLVLGGSNTYSGATSVSAGTLSLTGTMTSSLTTSGTGIFSETTGVISGGATLTQGSSGTSVLGGANTYTGATSVTAGTLSLTGTMTSGVTTSGTGIFSETGTGVIGGGATFTQGSSGTTVLGGANTYAGATSVTAGTLEVTNTTGSATGTGNVTVGTGAAVATLSGTGTISGLVTTASGSGTNAAHIAPGTPGSVGTLRTGTNGLTIGSGTNLDLAVNGATNDLIAMGGGTLTLSGTTTVNFSLTNPNIGTAHPYTLISGATSIPTFNAASFSPTGQGSLVPVFSKSGTSSPFSVLVTFFDPQTITFPAIANQSYPGNQFMVALGATATSGLGVTYTVTTGTGIASVTGNTLTITGTGVITVAANQSGNGTFASAPTVSRTFTVSGAAVSFSSWAAGYTFPNGNTGPTVSAFNDGVPNLLKYLYDIDPAVPITADEWAALPVVGLDTTSNPGTQYITLTYRQYASLSTGSIAVSVQTSPDLHTWTTLTQSQSQTLTTTIGAYSLVPEGNDSITGDPIIEIEAPFTGTRQFIRLNVSQP